MISSTRLAARCGQDGEFLLAARHWTGGLRIAIDDQVIELQVVDGVPTDDQLGDEDGVIGLTGPHQVWDLLLAAVPPRFFNDIAPAMAAGLRRTGSEVAFWQYYPAVARAVELLRADTDVETAVRARATRAAPGTFDAPVGRYVHIDLEGHDHRVYVEQAGEGIPLLLQHTAGASSIQWRHLFDERAITDHFRLIAYDLPFHGKSLPPTTRRWWAEEYRLSRDRVLAVPRALAAALDLQDPVFMGCSVGGQAALDLACYHPGEFRAVISLEPALHLETDFAALAGLWHPQVNNEMKARMMHGLTSPTSPEPLRRETVFAYSSSWPPAFLGDLHYYFRDHDLRDAAASIDTSRTAVHLLVGEYDWSATVEHAEAVHAAVAGSTLTVMEGLGHFPMSEDPERFLTYLLPVLDLIRATDDKDPT